jgi:hypothetical protein
VVNSMVTPAKQNLPSNTAFGKLVVPKPAMFEKMFWHSRHELSLDPVAVSYTRPCYLVCFCVVSY